MGLTGVILLIIAALYYHTPLVLLGLPVPGYGLAWTGHFLIEKNRPATFSHPLKSFLCDWIMYYYILTAQISKQLELNGIPRR